MGTRHLTCVFLNNAMKVAQYGQWDGYLSGQGQTVVDFLLKLKRNKGKLLGTFVEKLLNIVHLTNEEVTARWKECGADNSGWVNMDVADKFKAKYPQLSRDCGAEVLDYILTSELPQVKLDLDFAGDSLFCEWCYVVNLDDKTLEIFKGFNTEPLGPKERFLPLQNNKPAHPGENKYYPVKLWKKIPFSKLTSKTIASLEKEHEKENQ